MNYELVQLGVGRVHLQPVIRGLVAEGEAVRRAFHAARPRAVALSISEAELEGLRAQPDIEAEPSNTAEVVYVRELSRFGAVRKPPPCFVEALRLARAQSLPLLPLDMDDVAYTEAYVESVSGFDVLRDARYQHRLERLSFAFDSPQEFILEFDRRVNRLRGFQALEKRREEHMARRLHEVAENHTEVLALVELERFAGVRRALA